MNMVELSERLDKAIEQVAEKAAEAEFEIKEYTVELAGKFQAECDLTHESAIANAQLFIDRVVGLMVTAHAEEFGKAASLPARANLVNLCRQAETIFFPVAVQQIHEQAARERRP